MAGPGVPAAVQHRRSEQSLACDVGAIVCSN